MLMGEQGLEARLDTARCVAVHGIHAVRPPPAITGQLPLEPGLVAGEVAAEPQGTVTAATGCE